MIKKFRVFLGSGFMGLFLVVWSYCACADHDQKTGALEMFYCGFDYSRFYNNNPYYVDSIANIISDRNWSHPVFFELNAYDWLYLAYRRGLINEADFFEAQDYLQIVSAFGLMPGIPSNIPVQRAVYMERWNIFEKNEGLENFMMALRKHIGRERFEQLVSEYADSGDSVLTVVSLEAVFANQLHHKNLALTDSAEGWLITWVRFFHHISPALVYIDVKHDLLMLPGYKLFSILRKYLPNYIASERRVELKGHYCTMDMDDVVLLRSAARHPFAMYHPKHIRNLIKPHDRFLSTMASRHDFYHIIRLDGIPFEYQQWLLVEELIAEDFYRYAKLAKQKEMLLIDVLPEEVQRKINETEREYFSGEPQAYYHYHQENTINLGMAIFNDILSGRFLADQDFISTGNPEHIIYLVIVRHSWGVNMDKYHQRGFLVYLFFRINFAAYRWNQIYGRESDLMRLFNNIDITDTNKFNEFYEEYSHSNKIKAILKAWR